MFLIFFVSLLITSEIDSLNTLIVKDSTKTKGTEYTEKNLEKFNLKVGWL